jgi:CheY-like chemotaxis protein
MIANQLFPELQPCSEPVRAPRTLLVVEDEATIAEVLSIRLQRQGFETILASTGAEALEAVSRRRPDLVLLDVRLPDTDGFHICQKLMDDPNTCAIPVIILSGMERPDVIRCARAAGCRYYLRKPYDPNALLILIDQALSETDETF